jgi:sarcosine oxidase subunit alpha
MKGYLGDSIASALHANNVTKFSESLKFKRPRGFFCGIGKCSSCLMQVDDIPNVRTCIAPLKHGINVKTQNQLP